MESGWSKSSLTGGKEKKNLSKSFWNIFLLPNGNMEFFYFLKSVHTSPEGLLSKNLTEDSILPRLAATARAVIRNIIYNTQRTSARQPSPRESTLQCWFLFDRHQVFFQTRTLLEADGLRKGGLTRLHFSSLWPPVPSGHVCSSPAEASSSGSREPPAFSGSRHLSMAYGLRASQELRPDPPARGFQLSAHPLQKTNRV